MKQKRIILGTLLALGLAFSSKATIVFSDNFDGYPVGPLPTNNAATTPWVGHSGNSLTGPVTVITAPSGLSGNAIEISQSAAADVHANLTNQPYSFAGTNGLGAPVDALYASCQISVPTPPTGASTYFMHFYQDSSTFRARVFIVTNGAAPGLFRVAIQNGGAGLTNTVPLDLSPNTVYTIASRYILSSGSSTVWVNPVTENSSGVTATDPAFLNSSIVGYAFRQASGEGIIDVDNLLVGTSFVDVVPASVNPPVFVTQPGDTNVFASSTVVLKSLALGDPTIDYRWYFNTNTLLADNGTSIVGSTSNALTLTNLTIGQSGTYSCVASNAAGTNLTRFASLLVSPTPIPPTITNEPVNVTSIVGDTVSLTVGATGLPAPSFQWKYITNNGVSFITNNVAAANVTGTNSSTLTFNGILLGQAGSYFCTITNIAGYQTTNSTVATITVNPPPALTIAQFRAMVDNNYAPTNTTAVFTLQGTVTTWSDMTGVANTEFFMQDASGGIAVFWSGANATSNLPPAGAIVKVTGPMAAFNGLLEIEPVFTNTLHSVVVLSTNNPLPAPQPVPFDPNITGNLAVMKGMESMYFVASNVTLAAGATFTANANEPIVNNALHVKTFSDTTQTVTYTNDIGQTFTFFVNASTDVPGKAKPTGPVTIFGVMGFFQAAGFEFTPSRYADIVSYTHATNVLSNLTRLGDAPTNNFTESVLRPGETLTTTVTVGDPENGTVTLTPFTDGLPASAHWDNVTSGANATAQFHFTPTAGDTGTNYAIAIGSTSTTGAANTNFMYVYVPTVQEQQIYIGEFLANTTTNVNSPLFNPLHRANDTNSVLGNDQFVEIVNRSGTDLDLFGWSITDASVRRHTFQIGAPNEQLAAVSSNAVVVYGGPKTGETSPPQLPVPSFPANASGNLGIPFSGGGVIVLRSPGYFNNGLGLQPGYIVDRIVYQGSDVSSNGSLSRFPGISGKLGFVPQAFVNTNAVTPGLQYDGSSYLVPTQIPHGVSNVTVVAGSPLKLTFTANTALTTTLWQANTLNEPFVPANGQDFGTTAGVFNITNPPPSYQFYFLTTQTNY
jgi:hypothetical protein